MLSYIYYILCIYLTTKPSHLPLLLSILGKQPEVLIVLFVQEKQLEDVVEEVGIVIAGPFAVWSPIDLQQFGLHTTLLVAVARPSQHDVCSIKST